MTHYQDIDKTLHTAHNKIVNILKKNIRAAVKAHPRNMTIKTPYDNSPRLLHDIEVVAEFSKGFDPLFGSFPAEWHDKFTNDYTKFDGKNEFFEVTLSMNHYELTATFKYLNK